MFNWLKRKKTPPTVIVAFCPDEVERPAPDTVSVQTSILGEGSGFHLCLSAILGPNVGLHVERQVARVNRGGAERYEVSWWAGGERYVVRGTCQVEVAELVIDVLDEVKAAPAIAAYEQVLRREQ